MNRRLRLCVLVLLGCIVHDGESRGVLKSQDDALSAEDMKKLFDEHFKKMESALARNTANACGTDRIILIKESPHPNEWRTHGARINRQVRTKLLTLKDGFVKRVDTALTFVANHWSTLLRMIFDKQFIAFSMGDIYFLLNKKTWISCSVTIALVFLQMAAFSDWLFKCSTFFNDDTFFTWAVAFFPFWSMAIKPTVSAILAKIKH